MPGTRVRPLAGPSVNLVPGIPIRDVRCRPKRDGRDIGERSDAILRTAMPGHDDIPAMTIWMGWTSAKKKRPAWPAVSHTDASGFEARGASAPLQLEVGLGGPARSGIAVGAGKGRAGEDGENRERGQREFRHVWLLRGVEICSHVRSAPVSVL